MKPIKVGDRAPDVLLTTHDGRRVSLEDFRRKQLVVLFFYPKDNTRFCTQEACSFRDAYEDFVNAGAVVIGVSSDSNDSHREFAETHHLPFLLVADADGSLRRAFGVPKTLGLMPGRVTYVIDRDGIVRSVFNAPLQSQKHVDQALQTVRNLSARAED